MRVLDIGCGLGFTSEAFRELGAVVTGIDLSPVAVDRAKARFAGVSFRCAVFPEDLGGDDRFDLIWAVDLPIVGLFETENLQAAFLGPCLRLLEPDGHLVVGWHTNFSGRLIGGWVHWSIGAIRKLRRTFRASPVLIPQLRFFWLSACVSHICRVCGYSAPIYFCIRAADWRTPASD
jgi:SAM-dependent methyltransferase